MIDYVIKVNYIFSYARYQKIKRFSPEDSCVILTDLEVGNFVILSMYFTVGVLHKFDLLGNKIVTHIGIGVIVAFLLWAHFKINKITQQAPIRKKIKKVTEKDKLKYSRLAVLYFVLSTLLWILAFTWRVILYGNAAMVAPK